jgi:penicillin G amidase
VVVIGSAILTILLIAIVVGAYLFVQKSLPVVEGEITVEGLHGEVSVWRDEQGVPHIEAQHEHDLYVAQGYVTAQDRLFQMDLSRRQASGKLSEVVGEATVEQDQFFRTIGLRRAAEASVDSYSPEALAVLDAYAQGVNAYVQQAKENGTLPVEFSLMGYEPEMWDKVDSLTIGKFMAYDLGGNWEGQAFRYRLAQQFSEEKVLDLLPTYPEDGPTVIQGLKEHPVDLSTLLATAHTTEEMNGSNNWVISGEQTESGFPIVANDPHLGLGTPSIWYQTHLQSPAVNVSGVIFAGVPGIIIGHNDDIAWGVTNVGPDVQQLYIEKRNPENEHEFEYMGEWEQAEVLTEEIQVKDSDPIQLDVLVTRHGPIISEYAHDDQPDTALSLRWTALDPTTELEAVLKLNQATDWEQFTEALTYFHAPAQNFVFADQEGTIAYRANGLIPIRPQDDGLLPVPGWTDEYEWEGYIPWDELPTVVNPDEGFIATANNKIVDDEYPYHISNDWAQPYRQQRILDVIGDRDVITVEAMQALQFDHINLQAEEFVPILLNELNKLNKLNELNELEEERSTSQLRAIDEESIALLKSWAEWDYEDHPQHGAPLLFHLWMQEMAHVLFEDDMDEDLYGMFRGRAQIVDQLIRRANDGNPGPWIEDKGGLTEVTLAAFQRAVDLASREQGEQPEKWAWGHFHSVPFNHPLSTMKPLHLLFNSKPVPMGGSGVTVGAASFHPESGEVDHGAPWRMVVDLEDLTQSYQVVGPGQSGHVFSPWYDDQIEAWTTGQYHLTHTAAEAYRQDGYHLRLAP